MQKVRFWLENRRLGRGLIDYLKQAFFPSFCVYCKSEENSADQFLCSDCLKQIELIKTLTCPKCGCITQNGRYCLSCRGKSSLNGLIIAAKFSGPVRELIHYLKYNKMQRIAEILGSLISKRLMISCPEGRLVLIPVPLHYRRLLNRGFNQSELIAKVIAKKQHIPMVRGLRRIKNTSQQMKLKRNQRLINLQGAFKCRNSLEVSGKIVLLVDDVTTTGTTLNECAKVLKAAGAKQVWGLVVAKG